MPRLEHYHEVKEHAGRDFPYNIYPCSIPMDFDQVPVHWHGEMELIVIKQGQGLVTADTEVFPVQAGDVVAVFPGQLHGIAGREGRTMEYENIIFQLTMLMTGMEDCCTTDFLLPLLQEKSRRAVHIRPDVPGYEAFLGCIEEMDRLCAARPFAYQMGVKGALFRFLFYLLPRCRQGVQGGQKAREKIKAVLGYIEAHYQERITLEQAAGLCYYSKSHFMRFFKEYMGLSFVEYLNGYRLGEAGRQLAATEKSVTEIAQSCGFENISYFNRLFKERYGQTPGQYRKIREKERRKN